MTPAELVALVIPRVVSDAKNPKKTTIQLVFDESKISAAIDSVVKQAVVDAKPTIMNGSIVIQEGKSGVRLKDNNTTQYVLAALEQRQKGSSQPDTVQIPLVAVEPRVIQQAISDPRLRTGTGNIRLTFDDGPGAYTEQVLNILSRYNVHATFYLIGRNVTQNPGTVQRIVNEGHRVGNHSFSHPNLTYLSRAGVVQELRSTQEAIRSASGVTPTAFRPPQGAVNHTVREVAASMGLSIDLWSVDPQDWTQPGAGVITQRVLSHEGPGSVVLLHSLYRQTVDALPGIIEGIRAQGYTLE
jgi:peptidoglycan/xylan/chitin deacetylase (PgdA/CDA1 family)